MLQDLPEYAEIQKGVRTLMGAAETWERLHHTASSINTDWQVHHVRLWALLEAESGAHRKMTEGQLNVEDALAIGTSTFISSKDNFRNSVCCSARTCKSDLIAF